MMKFLNARIEIRIVLPSGTFILWTTVFTVLITIGVLFVLSRIF